jgi:N6-adenosine-specific RNA methylase IME4
LVRVVSVRLDDRVTVGWAGVTTGAVSVAVGETGVSVGGSGEAVVVGVAVKGAAVAVAVTTGVQAASTRSSRNMQLLFHPVSFFMEHLSFVSNSRFGDGAEENKFLRH